MSDKILDRMLWAISHGANPHLVDQTERYDPMTSDEIAAVISQPLPPDSPANLAGDGTPPGLETLPMPRGIYMRFQPLTVRSADYGSRVVDGECSECGMRPEGGECLNLECTTEGLALTHQCRDCGTQTILCVGTSKRPNPEPTNGKAG